jgi:hypothetical protein
VTCHGLTVKFYLKETKMTAPQSKKSVNGSKGNVLQEVEESVGNQKDEQGQERTLYQQFEWVIGDSQRDLFVLGYVGELLVAVDDTGDNQLCTGYLIKDYVEKIQGFLDELDGLVYRFGEEGQ